MLSFAAGASEVWLCNHGNDDVPLAGGMQAGQSGGNAVAEKGVDLSYTALGQFAEITRYADVAGTDLVATSEWTCDDAHRPACSTPRTMSPTTGTTATA
jgi:hypothetical protein